MHELKYSWMTVILLGLLVLGAKVLFPVAVHPLTGTFCEDPSYDEEHGWSTVLTPTNDESECTVDPQVRTHTSKVFKGNPYLHDPSSIGILIFYVAAVLGGGWLIFASHPFIPLGVREYALKKKHEEERLAWVSCDGAPSLHSSGSRGSGCVLSVHSSHVGDTLTFPWQQCSFGDPQAHGTMTALQAAALVGLGVWALRSTEKTSKP